MGFVWGLPSNTCCKASHSKWWKWREDGQAMLSIYIWQNTHRFLHHTCKQSLRSRRPSPSSSYHLLAEMPIFQSQELMVSYSSLLTQRELSLTRCVISPSSRVTHLDSFPVLCFVKSPWVRNSRSACLSPKSLHTCFPCLSCLSISNQFPYLNHCDLIHKVP